MFGFFKKAVVDKYIIMLNELEETKYIDIYRTVPYNVSLQVVGTTCYNGVEELYEDTKYIILKHRNFREWYSDGNTVLKDGVIIEYIKALEVRYKKDNSRSVKAAIENIYSVIKGEE